MPEAIIFINNPIIEATVRLELTPAANKFLLFYFSKSRVWFQYLILHFHHVDGFYIGVKKFNGYISAAGSTSAGLHSKCLLMKKRLRSVMISYANSQGGLRCRFTSGSG